MGLEVIRKRLPVRLELREIPGLDGLRQPGEFDIRFGRKERPGRAGRSWGVPQSQTRDKTDARVGPYWSRRD